MHGVSSLGLTVALHAQRSTSTQNGPRLIHDLSHSNLRPGTLGLPRPSQAHPGFLDSVHGTPSTLQSCSFFFARVPDVPPCPT